ncbi:iron chaperone [Flavobacterium sp.]|uniref:iron chaperone n=1 Tax=Flavobacterium sp. TaxID=239 RepID=UPI0037509587
MQQFEPDVQEKLNALRDVFFEVLPDTEESIRYKMPAFKVGKHHLYFAAYKKHIGFYPVYGLTEIEDKVSEYRAKNTKDSLHFMLDRPLPIELIKNIVKLKSNL